MGNSPKQMIHKGNFILLKKRCIGIIHRAVHGDMHNKYLWGVHRNSTGLYHC